MDFFFERKEICKRRKEIKCIENKKDKRRKEKKIAKEEYFFFFEICKKKKNVDDWKESGKMERIKEN